jgi:hypothetical protein
LHPDAGNQRTYRGTKRRRHGICDRTACPVQINHCRADGTDCGTGRQALHYARQQESSQARRNSKQHHRCSLREGRGKNRQTGLV